MTFRIIASESENERDIKRLKNNLEDLTSDLKKLNKRIDKVEDVLKDLNVGTRKFYQMVSPFNSLQRKVERFERLEIEFNRFKETMDDKIKKEITKKERAAGVEGGNYRIAQESWYSTTVAQNPNTSPEILRKISERGMSDSVSCYAAFNPNCPPDELRKILERGKNDPVSWNAAYNPNCPPDALKMVLERANKDDVSFAASRNPNCPLLAKIQWMRMTGQIGKEDPTKHIIEYDEKEQKPDEDLQKLRDMVSFNLNSYRIAQENTPVDVPFDIQHIPQLSFLGWRKTYGIYEAEFKSLDRAGDDKYYVFNVGSEKWAKYVESIAKKSVNKAIIYAKELGFGGYVLDQNRKFVRDL